MVTKETVFQSQVLSEARVFDTMLRDT